MWCSTRKCIRSTFLIYINDIHRTSNLLKFHLFADDTCIFSSNKNVEIMEENLNELKSVSCWLSANKLSLNVSKSSFLIFHPPQKKVKKIILIINNSNIPEKTCTKYLGVIIDKYPTWKDHIHYLNIKLSKANGILTKLQYKLPRRLMKTVYYALFKPHRLLHYYMDLHS